MAKSRSLPDELVAFVQSIAIATLSFVLQSSLLVLLLSGNTAVRQLSKQIQLVRIFVVEGLQRPVTKQLV